LPEGQKKGDEDKKEVGLGEGDGREKASIQRKTSRREEFGGKIRDEAKNCGLGVPSGLQLGERDCLPGEGRKKNKAMYRERHL